MYPDSKLWATWIFFYWTILYNRINYITLLYYAVTIIASYRLQHRSYIMCGNTTTVLYMITIWPSILVVVTPGLLHFAIFRKKYATKPGNSPGLLHFFDIYVTVRESLLSCGPQLVATVFAVQILHKKQKIFSIVAVWPHTKQRHFFISKWEVSFWGKNVNMIITCIILVHNCVSKIPYFTTQAFYHMLI